MDIRSIAPDKYIKSLAEALKKDHKQITPPSWIGIVKSGVNRQRIIDEPDFWYVRSASILRQIYIRGTVGVIRLRTRYGGRKNRGSRPAEFMPASGKIIRLILQQTEASGLTEKSKTSKAGRKLTEAGKKFLESIAEVKA